MDPQNEETPVNEETPTDTEETPIEEAPENEGTNNEESPEDIPADVLRANLTKANQEAARYRTRLREVEKALEGRKTDEDVEALLSGLKETHASEARNLLIENVALKHNLPAELAELLKGETRDELEKHAAVLAKYAPSDEGNPGDLNGGLNPGNDSNDDGLSPLERVRQIKGRR